MKKDNKKTVAVLVAAMTAFLLCNNALAWHVYKPLVVDGKVWNLSANDFEHSTAQYIISGDTLINEVSYKKLLFHLDDEPLSYHAAIREKERAVYICYAGQKNEGLLYDFKQGLTRKESVALDECIYMTRDVINTHYNGYELRFLTVTPTFDKESDVQPIAGLGWFLEGVGNIWGDKDPFHTFFYSNPYGLDLTTCIDGDDVIFSREALDNGDYTILEPSGDVNGDGVVDIADINAAIDMILGLQNDCEWDDAEANLAKGGKECIDIADVNKIISLVLARR